MEIKKKYGFYSKKSVAMGGRITIYRTPDGKEVEVTCVANDPKGEFYQWDDKIAVGEVTEFVSVLKAGVTVGYDNEGKRIT